MDNAHFPRLAARILAPILLACLFAAETADAATGNQSYAVYRDGAGANLFWHAGFLDAEHYNSYPITVMHITSASNNTVYCSWTSFLGGEPYKGTYKPKGSISSQGRDNVRQTILALNSKNIPYILTAQIDYSGALIGKNVHVEVSDITGMRCDGVIEYAYERNGYQIGGGAFWDISTPTMDNYNAHFGLKITPKSQAQSHMTQVLDSSVLP